MIVALFQMHHGSDLVCFFMIFAIGYDGLIDGTKFVTKKFDEIYVERKT